MPHILYSKGCLRQQFTKDESLKLLASLTQKPVAEIEKRLLNGKRKKIKSSNSLESLFRLKQKFESRGLECYIVTDDEAFDLTE